MFDLLWTIPAFPLAGFLLLTLGGNRLPWRAAAVIGTGSVGLSAAAAIAIGIEFVRTPPAGSAFIQVLWEWFRVEGFAPRIAFHLDALSLLMAVVVAFVAFWIHLYSIEFMSEDDSRRRFFAYMNLFVASMLILVLADNLLLLYLGWEGVGLCSYLLIGFWYRDPANGRAAQKAFIVTRVGDTAMAIGLFILALNLGTLDIQPLLARASAQWPEGSYLAILTAALLLGGAVGKSAQLPLQTWLPDAMAGPTPVSALIHAATMVTAGVYLIARMHTLFALAPPVLMAIAVIGAATLFIAGLSALVQRDIKRVLAYSTISQIGYMFLALGVGAWSAAMFHFMTHAFFKALLFLSAGVVIHCVHHEHDIFKMGGLRRELPAAFWSFLIGSASLAGLPLVTAGFYSKDLILWEAWSSGSGGIWLWAAGLGTAFITAVYIFRVVFVAFFGKRHTPVEKQPGIRMSLPLWTLGALALLAGLVETPQALGGMHWFSGFLTTALPAEVNQAADHGTELLLSAIAGLVALGGIYTAYMLYLKRLRQTGASHSWVQRFLLGGWGFDRLYGALFVRPFVWLAHINRNDAIDSIYGAIVSASRGANALLSATETGRTRLYAAGIAAGSIVLVALAVWL